MPRPKPGASSPPAVTRSPTSALNGIAFFLLALAVLSGAVWIVYGRAIDSPFIFDDRASVTHNPSIYALWPLVGDSEHPRPLNPTNDLPTSGRPLVNLSLALNYRFGGFDPTGYHVFNLMVHVLSALLLMAIVRRTLCLEYFGGRFDSVAGWLALAAALLWALHPLETETVIYITQRTELLVGLFYLATLYGSLRYWAATPGKGRTVWLMFATLACLSGMACKEVMVTAPVIVLLFERTFLTRSFRRALRTSWPLYIGLALGWGLLIWLNSSAPRSHTAGFHLEVPATAWWLTQAKVLWMYLKLAVWPWPLAIHYEIPYLTSIAAAWPWLLPAILLGIATLILLWRRNAIGFVGAWVLVILSPTLVVPIVTEVAAERRMYLPLAALVALVVVGGYALVQSAAGELRAGAANRKPTDRWRAALVSTIVLVLIVAASLVSVRRLAAYQNEMKLWQDNLALQPDDPTAHNNLGAFLIYSGRPQEAVAHCEEALRLKPNLAEAHNNLGLALASAGRLQEAIEHYQQALQQEPKYAEAQYNLGIALAEAGREPEAIEHFQQALQLNPGFSEAHNNLGVTLAKVGRSQEAIEEYQRAVESKPNSPEAYINLGNILLALGHPQEAIERYEQALQLKPSIPETHNNLGNALATTGRLQEAIQHYQRALRLNPNFAEGYVNLGNVLLKMGKSKEAIQQYQRALELKPNSLEAHYNLGDALSSAGRLPEAIEHLRIAVQLRPDFAEGHDSLGTALLANDQPQEAIQQFQQVLSTKPEDAAACFNLALSYARMKNAADADATANKALEMARSQGKTKLTQQIDAWLQTNRTNRQQ